MNSPSDGIVRGGSAFGKKMRFAFASLPPSAWFGIAIVSVYMFAALFAPYIAPFGETEIVSKMPFSPWSSRFFLGTDQLGRDTFSRLLFGARNTIGIALVTTSLAFLIGGFFGTMAAVVGGILDQAMSRLVDAVMAVPMLIFTLLLLAVVGASVTNIVLIIAVLDSTRVYRLARAAAMDVSIMEFVEVARARGERLTWLIAHEILPNIVTILIAEFGLRFCFVFLKIAALSFLGVGLPPPMAEWGSMVRESAMLITFGDITPLIPAAAIAVLTIGVNLVVDWLLNKSSGLVENPANA